MSAPRDSDPGVFESEIEIDQHQPKPRPLVAEPKTVDSSAEHVRRKKQKKSVPFKQSFTEETQPSARFENDAKEHPVSTHRKQSVPNAVRRRILLEPNFSLQKQTTSKAEDQFRQIILDQGITDGSLTEEIERGAANNYELGTLQSLRNVHDYVDYSSDSLVQTYVKEHAAGNLLLSNTFRYMILFVILLNTILIGLETNSNFGLRYGYILEATENVIMGAFILEILLKWYYHFDVFWKGGWNILDFVIVCILFFGSNLRFLGTSRVLRILRVVRAFRSLRDTPLFSGLSLIFDTIIRSLLDLGNICLLMVIIICLLGVVGVQLFGEFAPLTFGTFSDAIFSIFVCQTQRGWIDIFRPFISAGGATYWGGFIYFVLTITLTSFVLKNMFVAVIVSNLRVEMQLAKQERARKEAKRNNASAIKASEDTDAEADSADASRNKLVPMTEAARGWQVGEGQRRVLSSMFLQKISLKELQKYLFLQAALEESLIKYQLLRSRLRDIGLVVQNMNLTYFQDMQMAPNTQKRKTKASCV